MKYLALLTSASLLTILSCQAQMVDLQAFGNRLNGWKSNQTATYSINNNSYTTHMPTLTRTQGGGSFVSTRIEHSPRVADRRAVCFLETTFNASGQLVAGQIRINTLSKQLNTGVVPLRAPSLEEGEVALLPPTDQLIQDLFSRLDTELAKLDADDKGRRDLFGRFSSRGPNRTDLAAAIRHNLNLLLASTGGGGYGAK